MEDRKRTIFAVIIACVVIIAVLYSFGLNLFSSTPELILADPDVVTSTRPGGDLSGEQGGVPVEVSPETVQRVIADLTRYDSYSRRITVTYLWGAGGIGSTSVQVWVDDGWVRTDATLTSGRVEHSVVGNGMIWLWYDDETEVYSGSAEEMTADLVQRIPTYEDVLDLKTTEISQADYVERDGQPCIYVETAQTELGYIYRYWVSVGSGLLMAAETECGGKAVYQMSSREVVSPLVAASEYFILPDGTELRTASFPAKP